MLKGWPVATIKAGKLVAKNGGIVGPPTGRYLPRAAPGAQNELNAATSR
jgi:N-acyl-D-aspartate/D-glutamate deacylase